jgi:hypothetical protein
MSHPACRSLGSVGEYGAKVLLLACCYLLLPGGTLRSFGPEHGRLQQWRQDGELGLRWHTGQLVLGEVTGSIMSFAASKNASGLARDTGRIRWRLVGS